MSRPRTSIILALVGVGVLLPVLASPRLVRAATVNSWTCSTGDSAANCSASTITPLPTGRAWLGLAGSAYDNRLYAVDGLTGAGTYSAVAQAYSPAGNTWSTVSADSLAREGAAYGNETFGGTDYVYSVGGYNGSYQSLASYYSPSTGSWASVSALPTARERGGSATGSDGLVYVMGGVNNSGYLSTVEAYNPSNSAWYCSTTVTGCTATSTPPIALPTPRAGFGIAAATNGLIYTIGGQTGAATYTNVVEAYNPTTRTWSCSIGDSATRCSSTTLTPMPTARAVAADVAPNNLIYLAGGSNAGNATALEVYNPTTNNWACSVGDGGTGCGSTSLVPLPTARAGSATAFGSDGRLYVVGGYSGTSYLQTVEAYQPPTVPGAPTGVSASPGDSMAQVSWTAPGSTGGMSATGYTVSCSPACTPVTVSGSATTATVMGLTNGTAYTFMVTASNFVGTGSASAASGSVTPSCSPGPPALVGAAPGTFTATLTGSDQNVTGSLTSYSASNQGCTGWSVSIQATRMQSGSGDQFPAGSITMPPPTVSACQSFCGSGTKADPPNICVHAPTAIDGGSAVTVASAAASSGEGNYTFTPGTIASGNLQLSVPSYAYATTYSSTVTVSIVQGPAGSC